MLWWTQRLVGRTMRLGNGPNHFYGFWPLRWVVCSSLEAWNIYLLHRAKPKQQVKAMHENRIFATSEEDHGFLLSSTILISKNIDCSQKDVVRLSSKVLKFFWLKLVAGCWFNLYSPTLPNQSSQFAPFQSPGAMTQKQKLEMNSH